jgi:hypothetical protein
MACAIHDREAFAGAHAHHMPGMVCFVAGQAKARFLAVLRR